MKGLGLDTMVELKQEHKPQAFGPIAIALFTLRLLHSAILYALLLLVMFVCIAPLRGQQVSTVKVQPDCQVFMTLTTVSSSPNIDNRTQGCRYWVVAYSATSGAGITVSLQGASDVNGVPGTFSTTPFTVVSPSINPATSTTDGTVEATGYAGWVRMTWGSGSASSMRGVLYGWKTQPVAVTSGGGGGGGGSNASVGPTGAAVPAQATYLGVRDPGTGLLTGLRIDGAGALVVTGGGSNSSVGLTGVAVPTSATFVGARDTGTGQLTAISVNPAGQVVTTNPSQGTTASPAPNAVTMAGGLSPTGTALPVLLDAVQSMVTTINQGTTAITVGSITVQDGGTATAINNNMLVNRVTGTPTAGSAVVFPLDNLPAAILLVTGVPFNGATLRVEGSLDGGVTYYTPLDLTPVAGFQSIGPTTPIQGSITGFGGSSNGADVPFYVMTGGYTHVRVRAQFFTGGTAVVTWRGLRQAPTVTRTKALLFSDSGQGIINTGLGVLSGNTIRVLGALDARFIGGIGQVDIFGGGSTNITTADVASITTVGQNGQIRVTGFPTANSAVPLFATQAGDVYPFDNGSGYIMISGTWVGTLQFERTPQNAGATPSYTADEAVIVGAGALVTRIRTFTQNAIIYFPMGAGGVRIRATAWTSGTANIQWGRSGQSFTRFLTNLDTNGNTLVSSAAPAAPCSLTFSQDITLIQNTTQLLVAAPSGSLCSLTFDASQMGDLEVFSGTTPDCSVGRTPVARQWGTYTLSRQWSSTPFKVAVGANVCAVSTSAGPVQLTLVYQ